MSSLLPPNATDQERALEETASRLSGVPVPLRQLWNPDTCPANLLPWLAWAFSLDEWSDTWTEAQQRAAIKASYGVHRSKGTIGAVKQALAALGFTVRVQEWFNQIPAGNPYTYRLLLEVDQVGYGQADLQKLLDVVDASKNLRSHLDTIVPQVASSAEVFVAAAALAGSELEYSQPAGALIANGYAIADGSEVADGTIFPTASGWLRANGLYMADGSQDADGEINNGA